MGRAGAGGNITGAKITVPIVHQYRMVHQYHMILETAVDFFSRKRTHRKSAVYN
jgi:hypothetical protein